MNNVPIFRFVSPRSGLYFGTVGSSGVGAFASSLLLRGSSRSYASKIKVSRKLTLSPTVSKQSLKSEKSRSGSGSGSRSKGRSSYGSVRRGRGSQSAKLNNFLPSGSTSVTTTLGSGKFSVLYELDRKSRESHRNVLSKVDSFEALKIESSVRDSIMETVLGHLEIIKPTPIQTLAVKAIQGRRKNPLEQHTWLLAAETGSGKTLAYLAPLLSKLKVEEEEPGWELIKELPGPRAVILVPSAELIAQVDSVIKKIKSTVPLSSVACLPGVSTRYIHSRLAKGIDILICTPDKLAQLSKNSNLAKIQYLQRCKMLVIDEADSLMNDSFRDATLGSIGFMPNLLDLVFCTATIPRQFDRILREKYPDTTRLVTPKIHKLPGHIDFRVVEVFRPPYMDNKMLALKQALFAIYHDGSEDGLTKRVIVFVNRKESVSPLVTELNTSGFISIGIDGTVKPTERKQLIEDFISPAKTIEESGGQKLKVLVTTDLMARGVDTNRVRNIILYDLPLSSADLLHRAGRTGRLGARGRVLLLVNKKESQSWVKGLEKAVRKGLALA
ncbi:Mrh4p [Sugiyamaella lignohabitans]|uniref:RNA helicase n=1 Tax=Sugiyamaella lignohabitans TaxID=796027 RepID=A0A167DBE8_9ASCO|nr:Mrh4p [Sugiyamaella lignohabitans]ANB12713.1 Mrh4p [Sugiyamaella lignohabitans]